MFRLFCQAGAVVFLTVACFLPFTAFADGDQNDADAIHVMDPWIRAAPPVAKATAAYGLLHNHTKRARTLVGANSPKYEKIEMHASYMENGVASMREIERIEIPPDGTVSFEPNGRHLMLIDRKDNTDTSETVEIEFEYADGSHALVSFPVKTSAGDHAKHEHDHTHSH